MGYEARQCKRDFFQCELYEQEWPRKYFHSYVAWKVGMGMFRHVMARNVVADLRHLPDFAT